MAGGAGRATVTGTLLFLRFQFRLSIVWNVNRNLHRPDGFSVKTLVKLRQIPNRKWRHRLSRADGVTPF
jgi:hypothetical protein